MLTEKQAELASDLYGSLTDAQRDDDNNIEELAVALSRCITAFERRS